MTTSKFHLSRFRLAFFAIFIFGLFWRLYLLTVTQPAFSPDEMDYFLSARSVAYYGLDLTGTVSIFSLTPFSFGNPMAEFAPLFQLFTMSWLPITALSVKIVPVIFSCLLMIGTYLLMYKLFDQKYLALWTMLVISINPWAIFLGRTGYDAPISLTLFVWSFLTLITAYQAKSRSTSIYCWLGWLFTFLWAFGTYHGLKIPGTLVTICLVGYLFWRDSHRDRIHRWLTLSFIITSSLILAINSFFLVRSGTRTDELSFLNLDTYAMQSNTQRRLNFAPNSLTTKIFDNAKLIWLYNLLIRFAQTYDFRTLFLTGTLTYQSGVWDYGQFHLPEIFLILTAVFLLISRRRYHEIIFVVALLAVIPATFIIKTAVSYYAYQNSFLIILFAGLSAYAIQYYATRFPRSAYFSLGISYLVCLIIFGHNYFSRYPLYAADQWYFGEKLLSQYLARTPARPILVLTDHTRGMLRNYIVYTDNYTRETGRQLFPAFADAGSTKVWDDITFSQNCADLTTLASNTTVIFDPALKDHQTCQPYYQDYLDRLATAEAALTPTHLLSLKDSGDQYLIYNDELCRHYDLPAFSRVQDRRLLYVEKLDDAEFCQTYFAIFPQDPDQTRSGH